MGRKHQVCKEHEQWINELRVPAQASEEQIQEACGKLFKQSQKSSDSVDRDQRGQDQINIRAEIQKMVLDRERRTHKVDNDRQFNSVSPLFNKRGPIPRSVQFCLRSNSFVSSESDYNITTRFTAAS